MDQKLQSVVEKARQRDARAFIELCEMKAKYVLYYCRQNMRNNQDAEDAAQEAFIRMQKEIVNLSAPEAFNTWLNKLLVHTCIDLRRKRMKDERHISIDDFGDSFISDALESLPQEYIEDAQLRESVVEMVRNLPDKYKQCVLLHYYQNLSYEETATALDITPSMVRHNLTMARKYLRVELEDKMDGWKQAKTPMMAIGPALGAIFSQSADTTILPAATQQCLQAAGVYAAFSVPGAAASAAAGFSVKNLVRITVAVFTLLFLFASIPLSASVPVAGVPQRLPQATASSGYEDTVSLADTPPSAPAPAQSEPAFVPGAGATSTEIPAAGGAPVARQSTTVSGTITLQDSKGGALRPAKELAGTRVALQDTAGNELAAATLSNTASYVFEAASLVVGSEHRVVLKLPLNSPFAQTSGSGAIRGIQGTDEQQVDLLVKKVTTPAAKIVFSGGDCACGHVNPAKILIQSNDVLPVTQSWDIVSAQDKKVVVSGTSDTIQDALATLGDGLYTVNAIVKDEAGNARKVAIDFLILRGHVEPGQFT